ncbi:MAG: matrixin family metalloprotease [Candidatus Bathyarchaeota archaeon]|nr:matrixin family metalloprotease [Candidatus Bathyarchaeota archaeon]
MSKKTCAVFLALFLFSTIWLSLVSAQISIANQMVEETNKANDLINSNKLLTGWKNESTQVGVGTVQETTTKLEEISEGQLIYTYAKIQVKVPLVENLQAEQIITAKYLGGQTEDLSLRVDIEWHNFENDTIQPPTTFSLSKGMSIMFFIQERTNSLTGYIPYVVESDNKGDDKITLFSLDPQPTAEVPETDGYGFEVTMTSWGTFIPWSSMPWTYEIDPDGTPDISGTDEFTAIHAAFSTWENAPFCGVDFSYGGLHNPGDNWQAYAVRNYHNNIGWVPDFTGFAYADATGFSWNAGGSGPILETNVVLNDIYDWCLDAEATPLILDYDAQSTLTHEIGHAIGLDGVDISGQTMRDQATWDNSRRSLEWGDLNGAHYLYPEHNDATTNADAPNTFTDAYFVNRGTTYYGRLCNLPLPHGIDSQDWYRFYAVTDQALLINLVVPSNANFDLQLYDPSGSLAATSASTTTGQDETIYRAHMGASGFWRLKIYTTETDRMKSNGAYDFRINDINTGYAITASAVTISGSGIAIYPTAITGSSPDGQCGGISAQNYGDAAAINGELSRTMSGTSYIYLYARSGVGYNSHILVYVSQDSSNWYLVRDWYISSSTLDTIYVASTTITYKYVCIAGYNNGNPTSLYIDCVIATN